MNAQELRILKYLQHNPQGASPMEIINECGVTQPNARISGIRNEFECTCKGKDPICFASEHIKNEILRIKNGTKITRYFYEKTRKPWDYSEEKVEKVVVVGPQATLF